MKKNLLKLLLLICINIGLLGVLCIIFFVRTDLGFRTMDYLPKGEFLFSSSSPNKTYTINVYISRGNATLQNSVRCELVDNKNDKIKPKNIYWQYREETADVVWLDETHVYINDILLDVTTDTYDYRRKE